MTDHLLLTADVKNFEETVELAQEYQLGVELMAFAYPDILDADWLKVFSYYREALKPLQGDVTVHGPFMDMVSGSPDARINAVCADRLRHSIMIASELEAKRIIFHANFIGSLHNTFYREGWHTRNVDFWGEIAEFGRKYDMMIALENMWEFDPTIISDLLEAVNHPNLKACLDVGHAHVFTDKQYSFDYWLQVLDPWIVEIHSNNNDGIIDEHHGYDWEHGVLDYQEIVPKLRMLQNNPDIVLEMYEVQDMRDSLSYFKLPQPA